MRFARTLPVALAVLSTPLVAAAPAHAAAPVSNGSYVITSARSGLCLGTGFGQYAAGTEITSAACQGLLTQRWRLWQTTAAGETPARYMLIDVATDRCAVAADGAAVTTEDCGSVPPSAQFTPVPADHGAYTLVAQSSGRCLTASGQADGALRTDRCDTSDAQQFTLTSAEPLLLANPGFEQGTTGWDFSEHTGVGRNNPHTGTHLGYLDAGTGYSISQTVTAATGGSYELSAWIATARPGATLSVSVNGTTERTLTLPQQPVYAKYSLPGVHLAAGDRVTLAVGSSPTGWVNVDDAAVAPAAPNDPQVSSSDPRLVSMFDWAKTKANSWVQQAGAPGVIDMDEWNPSGASTGTYATTYWAGYPFRSDFYIRDFAHQMLGAHLLGLDAQNKTMLRAFAASANATNGDFPVWSVNFDAKTFGSIDYGGPNSFVRELPAPFELVQKTAEAYAWTGDQDYLNDPVLSRYVADTLGPFIPRQTGPLPAGPVPVPQATSNDIFAGIASYAENGSTTYAEAGDELASQYQAYLGAAGLARAKGEKAQAAVYAKDATTLKAWFNSTWSVDPKHPGAVVHAYDTSGNPISDWGYETSLLMPMKHLLDPGPRLTNYLSFIDQQDSGPDRSQNEEGYTYLPDTFFAGHDGATAWKWMQQIYASVDQVHASGRMLNGDYPEIPFTLLSQTVQGLLGVQPGANAASLVTASELPGSIGWLQVASIPVGEGTVTLRQDGQTRSVLTNTGTTARHWQARFAGVHTSITVDGSARPARTVTVDGVTYTYADVTVAPGRTATVAVNG
ncbi:ricin-type beta-trefoil lectin domain protein [Streptacidiphilus jiangxiensis]|uniref:Ricin-type beta-trefoil lectin domain-containing protein n=1 Tax=Streptacidiphilus jiangxiensis TaxID=235985 RepID=A0A1H7X4P8_STRJI|nr:ricin-type beta-trefoil lectin domain protein [Streptacidiphilus jiangxiensis]SEM28177.1 Ricin-type beta-trefoil lectin domain-containing protein [Streptacidiphilus jiangxiensis]